MKLYKPSDLHDYLTKLGIKPKKGMSQNFLIDGNIVRKIVAAADIKPGDTVLEIGPGPGAVSEAIVEAGANLIAVEKDPILAKALERLPNTTIHCQDILEFDITQLPPHTKVISNLPYHISTPILTSLVPHHEYFSLIVTMVQEEFARRMTARPNTSDYSSFTVFLNVYSKPEYAFKVSRNCFYPVPNVESAVVKLTPKPPPDIDLDKFFELTRSSFGHRRKMLRSSLKELYPNIQDALAKIGLANTARPEELSLDHFIALLEALS